MPQNRITTMRCELPQNNRVQHLQLNLSVFAVTLSKMSRASRPDVGGWQLEWKLKSAMIVLKNMKQKPSCLKHACRCSTQITKRNDPGIAFVLNVWILAMCQYLISRVSHLTHIWVVYSNHFFLAAFLSKVKSYIFLTIVKTAIKTIYGAN